jgi:RNA polymerase sigma-70 factor (ECF subfamily)
MQDLDDQALRELLPGLRRFALWLSRDASNADDLVQSCIERALTKGSSRRPEASLKSWLFTILYRQFIDGRRRASRFQRLMDVFRDEPQLEPSAEDTVMARSALESFGQLSADQRALLLMITVEGFSYQEAAQALDIPIGTVMSRLSRARQAYRQLTEGETPTMPLRRVK